MMTQFLRGLHDLGAKVLETKDPSLDTINEYYTCEITEDSITLRHVPAGTNPIRVTKRAPAGSGDSCNPLDANLKFLANLRKFKNDPFWDKCFESLTEAGVPKVLQAAHQFREMLDQYCFESIEGGKGTETFYRIKPRTDSTKRTIDSPPTRKTMVELGVVTDSITVVLTYNGTPLLCLPKVAKWWNTKYFPVSTSKGEDFDIITGERCTAIQTMDRLAPIDSPLISFNANSYRFEKFEQMQNYPMSGRTQDRIRAGFLHITNYDNAQYLTLEDPGSMWTTEVAWWVEGCVEHPILPLLGTLIRGGEGATKEEVVLAREALRLLKETDQAVVRFVVWQRTKSRFALLDSWAVSVSEARANILLFQEEWESAGYNPVSFIVTRREKPNPTLLPKTAFIPAFKAITTGSNYPDSIPEYFLRNRPRWLGDTKQPWANQHATLWFHAHLSRKYGIPMSKNASKTNVALKEYHFTDSAPKLESVIGLGSTKLTSSEQSAYRFGVFLALQARIAVLYNRQHSSKMFDMGEILKQYPTPAIFFSRGAVKCSRCREWLRANRPSTTFNILDTYINQLSVDITADSLSEYLGNQKMLVNIGWEHGLAYVNDLRNFIKQMRDCQQAGDKTTVALTENDDETEDQYGCGRNSQVNIVPENDDETEDLESSES